MNQSDLQQLLSSQTEKGSDAISKALDPLMPMLSLFFIISTILTVVVIIAFIIGAIQKHRTHKAILRIDKNLQKLVDAQFPASKSADGE